MLEDKLSELTEMIQINQQKNTTFNRLDPLGYENDFTNEREGFTNASQHKLNKRQAKMPH